MTQSEKTSLFFLTPRSTNYWLQELSLRNASQEQKKWGKQLKIEVTRYDAEETPLHRTDRAQQHSEIGCENYFKT